MAKSTVSHDDWLREQLSIDDEFMLAYLQAAFEDCESAEEILLALRSAVEARGISAIAEKVGVARESLSRALSSRGNPRFSTLHSLLQAIGLKFAVSPILTKEAEALAQPTPMVIAMQLGTATFSNLATLLPHAAGVVSSIIIGNETKTKHISTGWSSNGSMHAGFSI